jgi:subtilisin family serine protease
MSEKEYVVSLKKGIDCEQFRSDMISHTGNDNIPCRCINIANERPASQRNTHYFLTDIEAESLRNDPRILAVELRPDLREDVSIGVNAVQTGNFDKTLVVTGNFVNWGLRRSNESTNPYSGDTVTGGYNYTLDGTGVDIVIQDSGIQADHPEFQDVNGVSRVQQIDWYTASGLSGTQPADFYTDFDGHGTHVAGIAVGKTYGWAKNARIYAVKIAGLEGTTDPSTGIPVTDCFDVIKEWHRNKPVDPSTGAKRPTIVNMSWGYGSYFAFITGGNYRGTAWTGTQPRTDFGMIGRFDGVGLRYPVRIASVDVDIEELIDAGVHVVVSAGNTKQKIDLESGADYDNFYTSSLFGTRYYHRGGSPYSERAFIVGNVDSSVESTSSNEQKADSSETGPGVNAWAPGTNIMSATSTVTKFVSGVYPNNSDFKITNISGTSMAAPQVAGVLSLYLQINPESTPAQSLEYVRNTAIENVLYNVGNGESYTEGRALLGSSNKFLFNEWNSAVQMKLGR